MVSQFQQGLKAKRVVDSKGRAGPDALQAARDALAAHDYDTAHELLAAEVRRGGGRGEAPLLLLLLRLLVDILLLDAEALEAERALAPETASQPEVRSLLAVAAARLGRRARVEELLGGLDSPRAVEVWGLLAVNSLRAGHEEDAEASLARAELARGR